MMVILQKKFHRLVNKLCSHTPANTLQRVAFVIFILSYSPFSYISGNFPTFHFPKVQIIPLYFVMLDSLRCRFFLLLMALI